MLTRENLLKYTQNLYDYCEYPAVKYKVLYNFFGAEKNDECLELLRQDFLYSDIVNELYDAQCYDGGWGPLSSKNYSEKAKFPTSFTAINRCLYIGLTLEDRDILISALDYLEDFITGRGRETLYNRNERAIPWQLADISAMIERIKPYNEICDEQYAQWLYIAGRAFESGEYSYEQDKAAQHEVFFTREKRLIPIKTELLLCRREQLPLKLEAAMLRHFGAYAYEHGHFWDNCPARLPESFYYNKTRRWFNSFNYISQFKGSDIYLSNAVEWLLSNVNSDGLWDYGPQVNDPWGYFNYFSLTRKYSHNRVVDCTMEVLSFLNRYLSSIT